jgi:hypothetical protein
VGIIHIIVQKEWAKNTLYYIESGLNTGGVCTGHIDRVGLIGIIAYIEWVKYRRGLYRSYR